MDCQATFAQDMSLDLDLHRRYFRSCLHEFLPGAYIGLDTNRMTVVHFCVHALQLLGACDQIDKDAVIKWIYSLQIFRAAGSDPAQLGFRGGTQLGNPFDPCHAPPPWGAGAKTEAKGRRGGGSEEEEEEEGTPALLGAGLSPEYDQGHVAMAYTALATLRALGGPGALPPPGAPARAALVAHVKALQRPDGAWAAVAAGSERDLRFLYCACAVSALLGDWGGVDRPRALEYIRSCQNYDGAFGLNPCQESHGGSTYCAVAALQLMGELDAFFDGGGGGGGGGGGDREALVRWCLERQAEGGFQGRPNKAPDSCYAFWVGATLGLLGAGALADRARATAFVAACQDTAFGGFSKHPRQFPDVLHSFYSTCWLSLAGAPGLAPLDLALGVAAAAAAVPDDSSGGAAAPGSGAAPAAQLPRGDNGGDELQEEAGGGGGGSSVGQT